ncbi:hypothetical protein YC2023_049462 [Brassica napus]
MVKFILHGYMPQQGSFLPFHLGSDLCPGKILPSSRFPFSFILTTEDGFSYCSFQAVGYDFNTIQLVRRCASPRPTLKWDWSRLSSNNKRTRGNLAELYLNSFRAFWKLMFASSSVIGDTILLWQHNTNH